VGDQVRHLNRYRFALPYLWYIWVRYGADIQRMTMQRRLADALEYVYAFATDLVSPLLTALFEATEQESRAAPYRHRARTSASLEALRWQVAFLEAAEEQKRSKPTDRYQLFTLRMELSGRLEQEGRWEEGYHHAERALTMARTWNDEEWIARALSSMGRNLLQGAKLSQAENVLNQALAIRERVLGPDHPSTASSCNNLAGVYDAQSRYSEAEPLHQRALAIYERVLGPDHPNTANSCNNLAEVYCEQGRYSEAEPLYQRALAICERVLGPDHPHTATSCGNLAGVYNAQGLYSEAEPLYQRALAICERFLGPDHPHTVAIMGNYVALLQQMHSDAQADNKTI
jgi:tetratricopeptide (TPR) repeat protein